MPGGKRESHWLDLEQAKKEIDKTKEKAELVELEHGEYRGGGGTGHSEDDEQRILGGWRHDQEQDGRAWTNRERLENERSFKGLRKGAGG